MAPTIPAAMRALFDGVTESHAEIAQELRSLIRDVNFWDNHNPRFGLTSENVEDVLCRLTALAERIDHPDGGGDG